MAATAAVVDLTGVSEGGSFRPKRRPEGDYKAKVVKADDHQPKDTSKPKGWVLTLQVEGDARSTYPYYLSPDKKQAWKIGGICRAVGMKVPQGRMKFDPNKLVNRSLGIELQDEEYNDRVKSSIADVFPVSEIQANADEDPIDEGDIEEPIDDDEVELPEDEEEPEEDEEEEEPEPTPPPRKRVARKRAPEPEPEPEDDEEEDEEEEPPAPPVRRRAAPPAKKAATPARRKPAPVETDDDDDLDEIDTDDLD